MVDFTKINELNEKYKRKSSNYFQYGTAGFRTKSQNLIHVVFRTSILATLRSRKTGKRIGLMITASHNPEQDNGVKLIDPNGEMLEKEWEKFATDLVNCDDDNLVQYLSNIVKTQSIDLSKSSIIMIGMDTRSSSPMLLAIAIEAIQSMQAIAQDYGVLTTPMLHFFVNYMNTHLDDTNSLRDVYFSKLQNAFIALFKKKTDVGNYRAEINFDGANGVGAIEAKNLSQFITEDFLKINIYNDDVASYEKLNNKCGADFVKARREYPIGLPEISNVRSVSVDGDSDRLVYYYLDDNKRFHLLDGDKIAALAATYLIELTKEIQWDVNIGVVQTAYANGNSTRYILEVLKIPTFCVETGVKHLHAKAKQFDIGIYFEANGHGTILFSDHLKERIRKTLHSDDISKINITALNELSDFIYLINETVGDALSDLLMVEIILRAKRWDIKQWDNIYTDLPNKLLQVRVKDKNVIETTDAGRYCVKPTGLQNQIDKEVQKYQCGRSFVRPSGTEDVVRIFAEADTQSNVDLLAQNVAKLVHKFADGIDDML